MKNKLPKFSFKYFTRKDLSKNSTRKTSLTFLKLETFQLSNICVLSKYLQRFYQKNIVAFKNISLTICTYYFKPLKDLDYLHTIFYLVPSVLHFETDTEKRTKEHKYKPKHLSKSSRIFNLNFLNKP